MLLEDNEFRVLMDRAWSDEEKNVVLLFILEEYEKKAAVLHMGPPYFSSNVPIFVETYLGNERTLVQPFPRNGRWWAILRPKARDVSEIVSKAFSSNEFLKGFPENIVKALSESKMMFGEEVVEAVNNQGYLSFLERCLHSFSTMLRGG
jgi:tRNA nucleotidyltransferase (CCA-adding enzyme)